MVMALQHVEDVIHRLLTDEELRTRFALDRFDTIAELVVSGIPLTPQEIDLFVQSDVRLWFSDKPYPTCARQ